MEACQRDVWRTADVPVTLKISPLLSISPSIAYNGNPERIVMAEGMGAPATHSLGWIAEIFFLVH